MSIGEGAVLFLQLGEKAHVLDGDQRLIGERTKQLDLSLAELAWLAPSDSDLISEFWLGKRTWVDANEVTLGNADRTLDLTLRKGLRVFGMIRDTRGVPLEGATINLSDDVGPLIGAATDISGSYSMIVPPGTYQVEVFAPFRGERGDLLSRAPRDLVVHGFTRYDVVLEDANP